MIDADVPFATSYPAEEDRGGLFVLAWTGTVARSGNIMATTKMHSPMWPQPVGDWGWVYVVPNPSTRWFTDPDAVKRAVRWWKARYKIYEPLASFFEFFSDIDAHEAKLRERILGRTPGDWEEGSECVASFPKAVSTSG